MSGGGMEAWTRASEGGEGCRTATGSCDSDGGGIGKDCKSADWVGWVAAGGGTWVSIGGGGK